jgi:hypothetical protein
MNRTAQTSMLNLLLVEKGKLMRARSLLIAASVLTLVVVRDGAAQISTPLAIQIPTLDEVVKGGGQVVTDVGTAAGSVLKDVVLMTPTALEAGLIIPNTIARHLGLPEIPTPSTCGAVFDAITQPIIAACSNNPRRLEGQETIAEAKALLINSGLFSRREFEGVQIRFCPAQTGYGITPESGRIYLHPDNYYEPGRPMTQRAQLASLLGHEMIHIRQYRKLGSHKAFACEYSLAYITAALRCGVECAQGPDNVLEREAYDWQTNNNGRLAATDSEPWQPGVVAEYSFDPLRLPHGVSADTRGIYTFRSGISLRNLPTLSQITVTASVDFEDSTLRESVIKTVQSSCNVSDGNHSFLATGVEVEIGPRPADRKDALLLRIRGTTKSCDPRGHTAEFTAEIWIGVFAHNGKLYSDAETGRITGIDQSVPQVVRARILDALYSTIPVSLRVFTDQDRPQPLSWFQRVVPSDLPLDRLHWLNFYLTKNRAGGKFLVAEGVSELSATDLDSVRKRYLDKDDFEIPLVGTVRPRTRRELHQ